MILIVGMMYLALQVVAVILVLLLLAMPMAMQVWIMLLFECTAYEFELVQLACANMLQVFVAYTYCVSGV